MGMFTSAPTQLSLSFKSKGNTSRLGCERAQCRVVPCEARLANTTQHTTEVVSEKS